MVMTLIRFCYFIMVGCHYYNIAIIFLLLPTRITTSFIVNSGRIIHPTSFQRTTTTPSSSSSSSLSLPNTITSCQLSKTNNNILPSSSNTKTIITPSSASDNNIITNQTTSSSSSTTTTCLYCGTPFTSRNAVFRHLRTNSECYNRAVRDYDEDDQKKSDESSTASRPLLGRYNHHPSSLTLDKRKVAVSFGYYYLYNHHYSCSSEQVALAIHQAFLTALSKLYPTYPISSDYSSSRYPTQTSAAKLRHSSLSQDEGCSALRDVIGINYRGGPERIQGDHVANEMTKCLKETEGVTIRPLEVTMLPVSTKFHAERSCTQRCYRYLLPLSWLLTEDDDEEAVTKWARSKIGVSHNGHQKRKEGDAPPLISRLKQALKVAESRFKPNRKSRRRRDDSEFDDNFVTSPGRFGLLSQKERRCWHNFSSCRTTTSPSHESVWRSLDRARIVDFYSSSGKDDDDDDEIFVIVEFRGDSFLTEQIRRIISSIVSLTNGWIISSDKTYFDMATRRDVIMTTPDPSPVGLLYASDARFHFVELVGHDGKRLFATKENKEWREELHGILLGQRHLEEEMVWLRRMKDTLAPQINNEMNEIRKNDDYRRDVVMQQQQHQDQDPMEQDSTTNSNIITYTPPPPPYHPVLSLLRAIAINKQWPSTSKARSRVIRSPIISTRHATTSSATATATASPFDKQSTHFHQSGSFTIMNPDLIIQGDKIPLGNELFPELVSAVFELERHLSSSPLPTAEGLSSVPTHPRPPSSHCAINRNAAFTPHVDSGRGLGQSLSLLVGLGDFTGGELMVESKRYDVRYRPLEFDGWKQLHWTSEFEGERFSLVFFTPARKGEGKGLDGVVAVSDETTTTTTTTTINKKKDVVVNDDNNNVDQWLQHHQRTLPPHLPPLLYRPHSTDTLAISEILHPLRPCTYETFFKLCDGHKVILDIGAHIGAFSRYALSQGCERVVAYEPEPENFELLCHNLNVTTGGDDNESVVVYPYAVVANNNDDDNRMTTTTTTRTLVKARHRNDGTKNTWRHCLEEYNTVYSDINPGEATTRLPSEDQEAVLTRVNVTCIPFFGSGGVLDDDDTTTFVKMDCEGAEIDILLHDDCRVLDNWKNVSCLVFEWSFTKERRVDKFHEMLENLRLAGFGEVNYEGKGSWWDNEGVMWPYHTDLVVFAKRL